MKKSVLIVGAGSGLSASLAKLFHREDMNICLAARNVEKLTDLSQKTGAFVFQCDTSKPKEVANLFKFSDGHIGVPEIVIYNPSSRSSFHRCTLGSDNRLRCVQTRPRGIH